MPYARTLPHDARVRIVELDAFARARERRGARPGRRPRAAPSPPSEYHWHRLWEFPTEDAAERWNEQWEQVLEGPGSSHPAFVSIDGVPIHDRVLDALARVAAAILTEDVLAGSPYPVMKAGWSYQLLVRHTLYHPKRPGAAPSTNVSVRGEVLAPDGELAWSTDATRQYPADVIPASVGALWSARRWKPTAETWT
jgi:hypothetical protein